VARNIPTDLVVVSRKGRFFAELDARVNVVELPQRRTICSVIGLKRYIETARPVALVSALSHTNVAAIIANQLARKRTRVVVVEHNQLSKNRALKAGLVALSYRLVPWLYPKADVIAAVSSDVRDDIAAETGISRDRMIILHNPVVTSKLSTLAEERPSHPWLREPGPPVIVGVGRFALQKNFPLLVRAFAKVRASRPARLIILGEGELRSELEELVRSLGISADVDLPGFDQNPFRAMRRAAVYVLSSDWEGLPTALIEALACGTPVVTTDCAGTSEILLGGQIGRIVPRGDVDALATAISATLDGPGPSDERIARANEFGLEKAVDRYLEAAGWS
jgi:glycosyltransferase involved in cell wall biosynthesis